MRWVKTRTPEQTEQALMRAVAKKHWIGINETMVSFGQQVCVPISPRCSLCPLQKSCARIGVTRSR
jgi:endonuclease-3